MGSLILIGLGTFAFLRGIWMLMGEGKGWYFVRHLYAGFSYAQLPMGIGFLIIAIAILIEAQDVSLVLVNVGIGFGLLGVVFNLMRPSFLRPAWLKWLRHEHGDIYHLLEQDAHDMGLKTWERRMKTRENMEAWVAEVRRKHGLEK